MCRHVEMLLWRVFGMQLTQGSDQIEASGDRLEETDQQQNLTEQSQRVGQKAFPAGECQSWTCFPMVVTSGQKQHSSDVYYILISLKVTE